MSTLILSLTLLFFGSVFIRLATQMQEFGAIQFVVLLFLALTMGIIFGMILYFVKPENEE